MSCIRGSLPRLYLGGSVWQRALNRQPGSRANNSSSKSAFLDILSLFFEMFGNVAKCRQELHLLLNTQIISNFSRELLFRCSISSIQMHNISSKTIIGLSRPLFDDAYPNNLFMVIEAGSKPSTRFSSEELVELPI